MTRGTAGLILRTAYCALLAMGLGAGGSPVLAAQDTYAFDKGHTEIRFLWNHAGMTTQSGELRDYDGEVVWDTENVANSKVRVSLKAQSLDTGVPALDKHLKGPDFFDVEKFPEITFKSTEVRQTGVNRGQVTGDLTIRGVTKPVTLEAQLLFTGDHPVAPFIEAYAGAPYAAFSARTQLLRSDFGMGFGAPITSDVIEIVIETEMRRQN